MAVTEPTDRIRTREKPAARILDPATAAGQRMKDTYIRTKAAEQPEIARQRNPAPEHTEEKQTSQSAGEEARISETGAIRAPDPVLEAGRAAFRAQMLRKQAQKQEPGTEGNALRLEVRESEPESVSIPKSEPEPASEPAPDPVPVHLIRTEPVIPSVSAGLEDPAPALIPSEEIHAPPDRRTIREKGSAAQKPAPEEPGRALFRQKAARQKRDSAIRKAAEIAAVADGPLPETVAGRSESAAGNGAEVNPPDPQARGLAMTKQMARKRTQKQQKETKKQREKPEQKTSAPAEPPAVPLSLAQTGPETAGPEKQERIRESPEERPEPVPEEKCEPEPEEKADPPPGLWEQPEQDPEPESVEPAEENEGSDIREKPEGNVRVRETDGEAVRIRGRTEETVRIRERNVQESGSPGIRAAALRNPRGRKAVAPQGTVPDTKSGESVPDMLTAGKQAAARTNTMKVRAIRQLAGKTARRTAEKTAQAGSRAVQTVGRSARSAANALRSLSVGVLAGGAVTVIVVILVCAIGLLAASPFGVMFSGEDPAGASQTMMSAVQSVEQEYADRLQAIQDSNPHDTVEIIGEKAEWADVLAIYTALLTADPDNPQDAAVMTDLRKELLSQVFWMMNEVSYELIPDETTGAITLRITTQHRSSAETAQQMGFTEQQNSVLEQLQDEAYRDIWNSLLYGIGAGSEEIVAVALSQVGNVNGQPYWSWYGFHSRVEWCACFVSWCANQCGFIDAGLFPKFASCRVGVSWFREHGLWQPRSYTPKAGDIIFFDWDKQGRGQDGTPDHVGIVERVENGRVHTVEGNSGNSCRKRSYAVGYYEIYGYGIPQYGS